MKSKLFVSVLLYILMVSGTSHAQTEARLDVCQIRICEYQDGSTLPLPADAVCPPEFPLGSGNPLVNDFLRIKPLVLEIFAIPKPIDLVGLQFVAPPELVELAGQQGVTPFLPPLDLLWPGQLLGEPIDIAQFQSPQPIPLDNLPLPIPLNDQDFVVDSFFDIAIDFQSDVRLLGPGNQPLPIKVELNLVPLPPPLPQVVLNVCRLRICEYADGTLLPYPFPNGVPCPPEFPPASGNLLIGQFFRVKPVGMDFLQLPNPVEIEGIRFKAPDELVQLAMQQELPPLLPPDPNLLWPGQLQGDFNQCLQFQAPEPILVEPFDLPMPIPLSDHDFLVDSFFDVYVEFDLGVELIGPDNTPLLLDVDVNVLPPQLVTDINVCRYRVCEYLDGQRILLPFIPGASCPPFQGNPANILVRDYIRTIFKRIDVIQTPLPDLSIGGFQLIPPKDLVEQANQMGLPGVFLDPPVPMLWDPNFGNDGCVLYLPPQPIGIDPLDLPLPIEPQIDEPPLFIVDSFFDISVELNINCEFVDLEQIPIAGDARFNAVLLGDVNCDGEANLLDVGPFIELLNSSEYNVKGDMNGDGEVNLLDVSGFIYGLSN